MDELLLRRAQGGDPEAFGQLMEPLEQLVWRVCWHYTGNREVAEDCGQEAMVRIWRSLESYRGECALESWVYRIAANCCIAEYKAPNKKPRPGQVREHDRLRAMGFAVDVIDLAP